ncbi:MAG TPA: hypothetical protein VF627_04995 [Abditibacterium sp.]
MLQHQTKLFAVALLGLPLLALGCSGGGGNSRPRATATPLATTIATATATPSVTAVPATFNIIANFSQESGALPFAVQSTAGTAQISTQEGLNVVMAAFQDETPRDVFLFNIGTLGTLKSGDSFALTASGTSADDDNFTYNALDGQETIPYEAISGTFRINSLTRNEAVGTQRATVTIGFTLSNVRLRDRNTSNRSELLMTASGQITAEDFGELTVAKTKRR